MLPRFALIGASVLLAILALTGCTHEAKQGGQTVDAVLYTIGLSTDPYGNSSPDGFGVVTGLRRGSFEKGGPGARSRRIRRRRVA